MRCKITQHPSPSNHPMKLGLVDAAKKKNEPKKRITNKPAGKCHAQNVINIESGSRPESHFFQKELMKIKTAGNHAELKKKRP